MENDLKSVRQEIRLMLETPPHCRCDKWRRKYEELCKQEAQLLMQQNLKRNDNVK